MCVNNILIHLKKRNTYTCTYTHCESYDPFIAKYMYVRTYTP